LEDYRPENIKEMLVEMHKLEHGGDEKKHEMSAALAKAFVTPVDREDLALISQNIDEVTDSVEEILQAFYMYRIQTVTPEAIEFAQKLAQCCELMKQMLAEFVNFKKPEKLHKMVVELNNMEEDCDELYIESMMRLNDRCDNVLDIISWREIYNRMENCADACEHVGDCVDTVVMKNS
jgi:predicted phosphate transport protein (TIGR00153 family)